MGGGGVRTGGGARPPPQIFGGKCKIFNFHQWCPSRLITFAYCAPPDFNTYSRLCTNIRVCTVH